jgi:hypothetical protein
MLVCVTNVNASCAMLCCMSRPDCDYCGTLGYEVCKRRSYANGRGADMQLRYMGTSMAGRNPGSLSPVALIQGGKVIEQPNMVGAPPPACQRADRPAPIQYRSTRSPMYQVVLKSLPWPNLKCQPSGMHGTRSKRSDFCCEACVPIPRYSHLAALPRRRRGFHCRLDMLTERTIGNALTLLMNIGPHRDAKISPWWSQ